MCGFFFGVCVLLLLCACTLNLCCQYMWVWRISKHLSPVQVRYSSLSTHDYQYLPDWNYWTSLWIFFLQASLLVWWLAVSIITVVSFSLYTQHISSNQSGKSSRASTSTRKVFHFIVVAVYVPGLVVDPYFLLLASVVAFSVLGVLEVGSTNQYNIIVLVCCRENWFCGFGNTTSTNASHLLKGS